MVEPSSGQMAGQLYCSGSAKLFCCYVCCYVSVLKLANKAGYLLDNFFFPSLQVCLRLSTIAMCVRIPARFHKNAMLDFSQASAGSIFSACLTFCLAAIHWCGCAGVWIRQ